MDRGNKPLLVQTSRMPVYYKAFHCLADKCRDNCCMGWRVSFDKKDYLRLRRLEAPGDLKERMNKAVRRMRGKLASEKRYGEFDLEGNKGSCPFLDGNKLCEVQQACGHEVLPHVCTSYPRLTVYTPAAKEYALSPSCEGTLGLIWGLTEGIEFIEEPLPKTERRAVKAVQGEDLERYYGTIRKTMLRILQNRAWPLAERMLYLGIAIQRLQKEDWAGFDPDRWAQQTVSLMDSGVMEETLKKITGNRDMYLSQNLQVLRKISEMDKADWIGEIREALEAEQKTALLPVAGGGGDEKLTLQVDSFSQKRYEEALAEFEGAFAGKEYFFENLMVASMLYLPFPFLKSPEALWKSYVSFCNIYSFYRFTAVLGCKGRADRERLFHVIAMVSRSTLHSRDRLQGFQEELFQNDSSSLAHMAILLKG